MKEQNKTKLMGRKESQKDSVRVVGGTDTEKLKRRADVCEHKRLFV